MITSAPSAVPVLSLHPHTLLFVLSLSVLPPFLLIPPPPLPPQPASGPGPLLLAGYEDGSLLLWDVTQRSVLSRVQTHPEPVMCLTFDPSRLKGLSGSTEKRLCSWTLDGQNSLQVSDIIGFIVQVYQQ